MKKMLVVLGSLLLSGSCFAEWNLDNGQSSLHFITTKAGHVGEVHRFTQLTGQINNKGDAGIAIDLNSVDTGIPVRDQRMQELLFDIAKFPRATFSAKVDLTKLPLQVGQSVSLPLNGQLSLHGAKLSIATQVRISRASQDAISVDSEIPIIVNAKDVDLIAGIDKLREVAGLSEISYSVPVTFHLTFTQ